MRRWRPAVNEDMGTSRTSSQHGHGDQQSTRTWRPAVNEDMETSSQRGHGDQQSMRTWGPAGPAVNMDMETSSQQGHGDQQSMWTWGPAVSDFTFSMMQLQDVSIGGLWQTTRLAGLRCPQMEMEDLGKFNQRP
ncbi:hypothetical protein NHX12_004511 [Muraenolepis orangiensis]|uniref:Uncharacterized protein n=1 Tax=Muraenolepis orangiensis TaxID=630683 RepID=A0A9Q0DVF2_9TELE|nr:hypothetical protein NHX12_004511 [Muraenolepis orangiensis]